MTTQELSETRNEIMVLLKPNSGVVAKSGMFDSAKPEQVKKVNLLLKKNNCEVRKIDILKDRSPLSDYHQIYYSGNVSELLQTLKNENWIESAYLKSKSEDPGGF